MKSMCNLYLNPYIQLTMVLVTMPLVSSEVISIYGLCVAVSGHWVTIKYEILV